MKKKLIEAPLGYWEEESYMMVIPKQEEESYLIERIKNFTSEKEVKVIDTRFDIKGFIEAHIEYEKEEYKICFYLGNINVPEFYLYQNFLFKEEEKEAILNAKKAITIFMKFKGNVKKAYHLQLKIATMLIPEMIAVVDESAEKILPARWVKMTAESKIHPSAKDLFSIHAVEGKDKKIWIHTHGLLRCNITELEILESTKENYQSHYNLLITYAMYIVDKEEPFNPRENIAFIGRLINGYPIVLTCKSWTEGIYEYKKLQQGNEKDREKGHNSKTSIIFAYKNEEDEKNNILSKISIYDEMIKENPIFYYSDEETDRMKSVAKERFHYVKENFKKDDNYILIKIGLPLKEKGKFEYIWFELLEIKNEKIKAKLTQEPYDVEDIHTDDIRWYNIEEIADWIIYMKEYAINPSNAYLLEK